MAGPSGMQPAVGSPSPGSTPNPGNKAGKWSEQKEQLRAHLAECRRQIHVLENTTLTGSPDVFAKRDKELVELRRLRDKLVYDIDREDETFIEKP